MVLHLLLIIYGGAADACICHCVSFAGSWDAGQATGWDEMMAAYKMSAQWCFVF